LLLLLLLWEELLAMTVLMASLVAYKFLLYLDYLFLNVTAAVHKLVPVLLGDLSLLAANVSAAVAHTQLDASFAGSSTTAGLVRLAAFAAGKVCSLLALGHLAIVDNVQVAL